MGLKEDFEAAAERIKPVSGPNNEEMLEMYGLYKQATVGDNNTPKPGMLDLKGKKKWEAWNGRKGMSADEAMRLYIEVVEKMLAKYAAEAAPAPA